MTHSPLTIHRLTLQFPHKLCFQQFSRQVHYGKRIAIIGRNGSGKSMLLKIIQGLANPSDGQVTIPNDVSFAYVPQLIAECATLSGAQKFNKVLSSALAQDPNILCLDEPTNHLDVKNRTSLMRMLKKFHGTVLVVTHDIELLRTCIDEIWDIDNGTITCFAGNYDDYLYERQAKQQQQQQLVATLEKEHKKIRAALHFEQQRAAKSKQANKDENDRNLKGKLKETASQTASKKRGDINKVSQTISNALDQLHEPEVIKPKFNLTVADLSPTKTLIDIIDGSCGYAQPLLQHVALHMNATDRVALVGPNGSGKSTLVKAILQDNAVVRSGTWIVPNPDDIGYLDQHYANLNPTLTVLETIEQVATTATTAEIRKHLNDFLFRKNEEVSNKVSQLSGGEKVRLSLAVLALQDLKLLILDEVTNNVDLQTRQHIIEVLREYPGALLVISHDQDFLEQIGITTVFEIERYAY